MMKDRHGLGQLITLPGKVYRNKIAPIIFQSAMNIAATLPKWLDTSIGVSMRIQCLKDLDPLCKLRNHQGSSDKQGGA